MVIEIRNQHQHSGNINPTQSVVMERIIENPRGGYRSSSEDEVRLVYRIKEDPGLVRAAEKACENRKVQSGINHLIDELEKGNPNPGTMSKPLGNGLIEYRHRDGGRVIARRRGDLIEILGKCGKDKKNQKFVRNRVKRNLKERLYDEK